MGVAEAITEFCMKKIIAVLLAVLSACATDRSPEDTEGESSDLTVYGQLSVSVDRISVESHWLEYAKPRRQQSAIGLPARSVHDPLVLRRLRAPGRSGPRHGAGDLDDPPPDAATAVHRLRRAGVLDPDCLLGSGRGPSLVAVPGFARMRPVSWVRASPLQPRKRSLVDPKRSSRPYTVGHARQSQVWFSATNSPNPAKPEPKRLLPIC
jgi:hypothetical protein